MKTPMYRIQWNNGFWKIFNLHTYRDEAIVHTEAEAKEALKG